MLIFSSYDIVDNNFYIDGEIPLYLILVLIIYRHLKVHRMFNRLMVKGGVGLAGVALGSIFQLYLPSNRKFVLRCERRIYLQSN